MTKRIAIIGAGITGALAAIGLAQKGIKVDLIDRAPNPLSQASLVNEGKVHLGFLYAHDRTWATPRLMIDGAHTFRPIIQKLTGFDVSSIMSTPFYYAVHRDSLVTVDDFEHHLIKCCATFDEVAASEGGTYVDGMQRAAIRKCDRQEWEDSFDPDVFSAFFETSERAVDPRRLAPVIRAALANETKIDWWSSTHVERIHHHEGTGWKLTGLGGEPVAAGTYDIIINSTWSDLIRLDSQVGIEPLTQWSYRYKLGNRVLRPVSSTDLMSVTVVLGAFGDLVNFGSEGGIFLSWYPTGRLLMTTSQEFPDLNAPEHELAREGAYEQSRNAWEAMSPQLKALEIANNPVDVRGGMILASGRQDVDDAQSPLHSRVQVGINQSGTYLSVNTGKYALAPLLAQRVVSQVASMVK